jgi:K+ transport systems, NAD-binding component
MRIAVLGLGDFGFSLAYWLNALGNEVIAVDRSADVIQRIMDNVSKAIVADATDREVLEEIGIRDVDVALIAVGRRLESTVLLTNYLRELGIPRVMVKVADEEQGRILRLVGATDVVQPDRDIAAKVAASLTFPDVIEYVPLEGQMRIFVLKAPERLVGRALREVKLVANERIRVLAVDPPGRDKPAFVPDLDYVVSAGDLLVAMGDLADLLHALRQS